MSTYTRPASLDDALALLADDGAAPFGGGTDLAGQADRGIRMPTVLVDLRDSGLGAIEAAIGRHPVDRKRMAVRKSGGRPAVTEYWIERRFGPPLAPLASLLGAKLRTGRTHQVRVHLAYLGCPVVGDPVYGRRARNAAAPPPLKAFNRQALHAAVLAFRHPGTGKEMRFASELPQDFRTLLSELNDVKSYP